MADHLYLHLTGLCGLVPKKPIDQPDNQMRVLLVDAGHHEPHLPVLLCPFNQVDTSAGLRQPDRVFYDVSAIKTALFFLAGQDLKVGGAAADKLKFKNGNGSGSDCHTLSNLNDVEWVAAVETIDPGSGTVKRTCFDPATVDPAVAARVRLTEGTVTTRNLATDGGRVINWQFKEPTGAPIVHRQAISEIVQYDYSFTATGSTVDLLIGPFGTTSPDKIRLKLQGSPKEVTAFVKNVPALEIFSKVHNPGPREDDVHFAHYYDLSTNVAPTRRVPSVPTGPYCSVGGGPSVKNPHCPPALFEPNAQA